MVSVSTRRHIFKFYLTLFLSSLFLLTIGVFMLYLFIDELDKPHSLGGRCFFLAAGLFVVFVTFHLPHRYFRNSPGITVDATGIRFNQEFYGWADLEELQLTGKQPFRIFMGNFPMEGMMLRFKDGTVKYTFDDVYANAPEIKSFIQTVVVEKRDPEKRRSQHPNTQSSTENDGELFKGNQFTSFHGIILWAVALSLLTFITMALSEQHPGRAAAVALFLAGWFFLFTHPMNYAVLTPGYLIVKNHNLPWKSHTYPLGKIKEVVFESHGNQPNCLRIISTDFRNKLYPCATLRDKTWLALEKRLTEKGISVRNECIQT